FSYKDKEVLHGVSMEIPEGNFVALVGPSGSGKSTIARLIASLWDVSSGSITLGGKDIRDIPQEAYADKIAFVSQDNYLFNMTVRENIRLGRPSATDAEVEQAAKASGCHEFILGLEKGYDTLVGSSGGHLSGGERQRISIARAMLKAAPIVILDEATAYTDPENEAVIQRSVSHLTAGKTLIVIAHRLSTITDADRIYVVKDGQIDDSGTHAELLSHHGLYEKMYKAHMEVKDHA
ncbi:MAG: ATP-binding cassette domain-containing protein, partial [Clostridia bacterium]|nr:ATP-binding cassette domain-containing protein [Clostridia bacterium]